MNDGVRTIYHRLLSLRTKGFIKGHLSSLLTTDRTGETVSPTSFSRAAIANMYLNGDGIEIGALHAPLEVPRSARVRYLDRLSAPDLRKHYPELDSLELVSIDIVDDGERLDTVSTSSQDFVIANHFIEHCQDPVTALGNMVRVLKPGGVLYLAIPDKRHTFDIGRAVTGIDHVLKDYEEGPAWSKRQHFEEWVRLVNRVEGEAEVSERVEDLMEHDYSIHYHVWTQAEMHELLLTTFRRLELSADIELFVKHGMECIFILRKMGAA